MRVLLDENISNDLKKLFLAQGFDVLDLKEKEFRQIPDEEIVRMAMKDRRVIITHDRDFLPYMIDPKSTAKILLLSIQRQTHERMIAVGKFILTLEVLTKLKKSAIVYYLGDIINISEM